MASPYTDLQYVFARQKVTDPLFLISGGGVALLYASKELESTKESLANFDQQIGVQIVQNALRVPLKTIADNAGKPNVDRCLPNVSWLELSPRLGH